MTMKRKDIAQNILKKRFHKLKEQFTKELHSETLRKYKILSEAYKIGKRLDKFYTVEKLSIDFEVPYTTAKRILSLDRATTKTWGLIKAGKISSFKAAQVCMSKRIDLQNEIIETVIKQNLSTYDIDKMRQADSTEDVRTTKLKIAVERGYSRDKAAWYTFKQGVKRMMILLDLEPKEINIVEYKKILIQLRDKIDMKVDKHEK